MNDDPIFTSTHQALHFSYLIEAYEVAPESIMAITLRRLMKELMIWEDGYQPSGIDFSGLTPLEVRAQCAIIRRAVKTELSEVQAWVVQARFGITEVSNIKGKKVFHFSRERQNAILRLGECFMYVADMSELEVDALIVRHFSHKARKNINFSSMQRDFGKSRMTYSRAYKTIEDRCNAIEKTAIDVLRARFERHGVIAVAA